MKKIFITEDHFIDGNHVIITGNDFHHMANVLRVKIKEHFFIGCDSIEYEGKITEINSDYIKLEVKNVIKNIKKKIKVTLLFSLLKGDKNDLIFQKCTELGVDRFIPVITGNTIIKLDDKKKKSRLDRWNTIVKEASMQSGRDVIPTIKPIVTFEEAIVKNSLNNNYFCKADAPTRINSLLTKDVFFENISIFIGPEGDFTNEELNIFNQTGWKGLNISPYTLRSETACISVVSLLSYFYY